MRSILDTGVFRSNFQVFGRSVAGGVAGSRLATD